MPDQARDESEGFFLVSCHPTHYLKVLEENILSALENGKPLGQLKPKQIHRILDN